MNKISAGANKALAGVVKDGQTIVVDDFSLCGIPEVLTAALRNSGTKNLTCISNNAGVGDSGLGLLLEIYQVRKMISSYAGENKEFERQYLADELELGFAPQGTLAEKLRIGGTGIPAFFIRTSAGMLVVKGKEPHEFDGETYIIGRSLVPGVAPMKAQVTDESGNLHFNLTACNFNPAAATTGKICTVEVGEIVEVDELAPDDTHLLGIYAHRTVLSATPEGYIEKCIIRATD